MDHNENAPHYDLFVIGGGINGAGIARDAAGRGLTVFSLDTIPRTTRAQAMDVLSSQANIAGYKAVLLAAMQYSRYFPMFMTAAGLKAISLKMAKHTTVISCR